MNNTLKHIALKNRVFYNINVDDSGLIHVSLNGNSYEEYLISA